MKRREFCAAVASSVGAAAVAPLILGRPGRAAGEEKAGRPVRLPLVFEERAGVDRRSWPVRGGVPMPQGLLAQGAEKHLRLLDPQGRAVPMAPAVLAAWPDGSAKWILLDAQVDLAPNAKTVFTLAAGDAPAVGPRSAVKVSETDDAITVDTGVLRFAVRKKLPGGLDQLAVGGKPWPWPTLKDALVLDFQAEGPPPNDLKLRGRWKRDEKPGAAAVRLTAAEGKDYSARVEVATPMRAVLRTEGWYGAAGRDPACRYVVRYTAFAGQPYIAVHHTFIFTEDADKFFIRRLGLRLPFGKADTVRCGGAEEGVAGHEAKLEAGRSASLLSIGPEINHNDVLPSEAPQKDVAYSFFTYEGDGSDPAVRREVAAGKHALGCFTVTGEGRGLTVAVRDFWRQHPNELAWSATDGAAECWLWANHGGKVIDTRNPSYNLVIRGETRLGGISTGFAKTHEILLYFHPSESAKAAAQTAAAFDKPVWPYASAEWNCRAEAIPCQHPYDPQWFPGLERQIETLYAWLACNQRLMHWDGFFDYGDFLIEFDNHGQRYSGGRPGTWVWRDYAGWINEDGQQTHHLFMHYLRTCRADYMRMGEAMARRITDVSGIHHHNPAVPHSDPRVGGAHRHDMTPWHSLNTGYSMATLGAVDYYYLTGDERMREIVEEYGRRCDEDGIGVGFGGAHFGSSLARIWEATGNAKFKEAALRKIIAPDVQKEILKPHFRVPTDLYPHLMIAEQVLGHRETADILLKAADTVSGPMPEEIYAWAYVRTKDRKYLDKLKDRLAKLGNVEKAAALPDPWAMNWQDLRRAMDRMPSWYVKVYINSQQVGRYPAMMRALAEAEVAKR